MAEILRNPIDWSSAIKAYEDGWKEADKSMTDVDEAKAVLAVCANPGIALSASDRAQIANSLRAMIANSLRAMIAKAEQADEFEAFKRDVSDKVEAVLNCKSRHDELICIRELASLVPPKPVDPLVEAMSEAMCGIPGATSSYRVDALRAALAKRGLQISEVQP